MQFSPLGDGAVTASASQARETIHPAALTQALRDTAPECVLDVVAAFDSVTVFYDFTRSGQTDPCTYEQICEWILAASRRTRGHAANAILPTIEIPVYYGGADGPDLSILASARGISESQVIRMHCAAEYTVLAVGFMPGFAYLGGLPAELHAPRLATPRTRVPAGSVGVGGTYTGVYPIETPGGWNIIGRTSLQLFDQADSSPAKLHVGQKVRFHDVNSR